MHAWALGQIKVIHGRGQTEALHLTSSSGTTQQDNRTTGRRVNCKLVSTDSFRSIYLEISKFQGSIFGFFSKNKQALT